MQEREILFKETEGYYNRETEILREDLESFVPSFSAKATLVDLGERSFDFKYVSIRMRIKLEVNGKIKNKNAADVRIEYDPDKAGKEFSIIAKHEISDNLALRGTITPGESVGLGVETKYFGNGVFKFDAKLNWTALFEAKYEIPFTKSVTIGNWVLEGGGKLVLSAIIGPNWKNIAWDIAIKRGWTAIQRVIPSMISAIWTTSAGTATALNVVVSTVGFVALVIAVPLYMFIKGMTAEAEGKMEVLGDNYASGYSRTLAYKLTFSKESEFGINDFTINTTGKFKNSIQSWSGQEAWPKIEALAKDNKLRLKALSKVLKSAYRDLGPQSSQWIMARQNARSLGAAHALSTTLEFARLLKLKYGTYDTQTSKYSHNEETNEIINILKGINSADKNKFRNEIYEHIFKQFKNKVGKEDKQIEGYPIDLAKVIRAKIK